MTFCLLRIRMYGCTTQSTVCTKGNIWRVCDYRWAVCEQGGNQSEIYTLLRSMHLLFRQSGAALRLWRTVCSACYAIAPDSEADGCRTDPVSLGRGNRSEALRVYRQLEQVVREQLGVALEEETLKLYKKWDGLDEGR